MLMLDRRQIAIELDEVVANTAKLYADDADFWSHFGRALETVFDRVSKDDFAWAQTQVGVALKKPSNYEGGVVR